MLIVIIITELQYLSLYSCREYNLTEILKKLWTTADTAVQRNIIDQESLAARQAGRVSSLFSLAKDTTLKTLFANNSQERLAGPLVDKLEGEIPRPAWEQLASYPGRSND